MRRVSRWAVACALAFASVFAPLALSTVLYSNNYNSETTGTLPSGCSNISGTWVVGTANPITGSTKDLQSSTNANGNVVVCTGGGNIGYQKVTMTQKLIGTATVVETNQVALMFRMSNTGGAGYLWMLNANSGQWQPRLYRVTGVGAYSNLNDGTLFSGFANGDEYTMEVIADNTKNPNLEMRAWKVGNARPSTPTHAWNDTTVTTGYFGFYRNTITGSNAGVGFVQVEDAATAPPTTATLSGPTSGTTGSASTNFTITTDAAADQTYTFTPAGTVGTVTFTPSSPQITTGTSTVTFTANPGIDGTHAISITSSPSLTIAGSPINYVSTNGAATSITHSGPSSGSVGSPSTNFTVGANGTITGTVVVTPSDGGGGGTFTPTTVSINTGSPTGTYTYTPASAGAKTISVTNNGGLANPADLTYTASSGPVSVAVTNANWKWSPYNWYTSGSAYKLSNNPGAYSRLGFTGTSVAVNIDVSAMSGVTTNQLPTVLYWIDQAVPTQLELTTGTTTFGATGLASGNHTIEFWFDGNYTTAGAVDRWNTPTNAIKITGATIDAGATTVSGTLASKTALWFGDSISEGSWNRQDWGSGLNLPFAESAFQTVPSFLRAALDVEMGIVAFGGQNFANTGVGNVPTFPNSYDKYFAGQSRLVGGQFSPVPDYIFVWHGENGGAVAATVTSMIGTLRTAAPTSRIFILVPASQTGVSGLTTGVANYVSANPSDTKVHLIDLGPGFAPGLNGGSSGPASIWARESQHPRVVANARMAPAFMARIQAILDGVAPSTVGPSPGRIFNKR